MNCYKLRSEEENMSGLKVGFAQVNINPPLGIGIQGYYVPRYARGFLDDLEAETLVLSCAGTRIALISVDNCGISTEQVMIYRAAIEAATGLAGDHIWISASHTHTAGFLAPTTAFDADPQVIARYAAFVGERLVDAVKLALADLKPGKMAYIVGRAPKRVAYIRRYKMKDGTTMTCPPVEDTGIDHPIGELDQRVNVLRFDREGRESVVLVNYGLHADTVNGDMISADWPGYMRKTVEKTLDGTKCMFFVGAMGDVGSTNVHPSGGDMNDTEISFDNEMKSPGMARFIGHALAGTILQVFDKAAYVDVDNIRVIQSNLSVPSNMPTPAELKLAIRYKELHDAGRDDEIPYTAMELSTVVAEALRMYRLKDGPEAFTLNMSGMKIGPIALVAIPGQPFTDAGVAIKDTPGFDLILPCTQTNGSEGYFPSGSAYAEGGYETRTSPYKAGVAERIVEEAKALLERLLEEMKK